MIQVGINEDVILKNVELTEKDGKWAVNFALSQGGQEDAGDDPLNEVYDEDGMLVTGSGGGMNIKVWPINVPKEDTFDGKAKTIKDRIDEANEASKEMQNLFTSFARCYLTSDKIKFERFRNIPITKDSMQILLNEDTLLLVTKNLVNQFIEMCSPFFGQQEYKLRLLLRRQSVTKHYPALRDKLLQAFPFVELMAIPKSASKIAFTKYEISKGLNSGTPSVATDAPAENLAPVDTNALFGTTGDVNLAEATELN